MLYRLMRTMRERAEDQASKRTLSEDNATLSKTNAPVVIGGTGGSGTRTISRILTHAAFSLGENLNVANDSLDLAAFLHHWVPQWVEAGGQDLGGNRQERMDRHFLAALVRLRGENPQEKDNWLIKNPRLMFILPFVNRHFPTFKFVHLVRDGRDMAFSGNQGQLAYLGSKFLEHPVDKTNPVHSAELWAKANMEIHHYGKTILNGRYLQIRFEDLCHQPQETATKLFHFLGQKGDVVEASAEITPPSSLGRWKKEPSHLLSLVQKACQPALDAFGYERNS